MCPADWTDLIVSCYNKKNESEKGVQKMPVFDFNNAPGSLTVEY